MRSQKRRASKQVAVTTQTLPQKSHPGQPPLKLAEYISLTVFVITVRYGYYVHIQKYV